jgi:Kef-type K+ transport system membrane component KefB
MLELYFLFYRIPKMMTRLARERNRSALAWSLIGIAAWIGAEIVVGFTAGLVYVIGIELWGWPRQSSGFNFLAYLLGLAGALVSVTVVSRILTRKPREEILLQPPPPPTFRDTEADDVHSRE